MFTSFRNRLTYFGTLDDVVYRYPWPNPLSLQAIQHELVTAAVYDKKILINDGYLIANPQLITELTNSNTSLIGNLLHSGIARIFARGGSRNLAEGLEGTAKHIPTHQFLLDDERQWRAIRDSLESLSRQIAGYTVGWPADKNMGELFCHLLERIYSMSNSQRQALMPTSLYADFDKTYEIFVRARDPATFDGARTCWENACWKHATQETIGDEELKKLPNKIMALPTVEERKTEYENYPKVRLLMNVANDIYHLSYTLAALHAIQSSPPDPHSDIDTSTIGMASSVITSYPDLLDYEIPSKDVVDARILEGLDQLLITIPSDIRFGNNFNFVSTLYGDINCSAAREAYLSAIERFVSGRMSFDDAAKERDCYIKVLAKVMAPWVSRNMLEKIGPKLVEVSLDTLVKIPYELVNILFSIGTDYAGSRIVERLVQIRVAESLHRESIYATMSKTSEPLARKLGLYVGPIKRDGAAKTIAKIKPHPASLKK
jgi:hypothetical protein